jgi:hypothetical protein
MRKVGIEENYWLIRRVAEHVGRFQRFGVYTTAALSRAIARSSAPLSPSEAFLSYRPYYVSLGMFVVEEFVVRVTRVEEEFSP